MRLCTGFVQRSIVIISVTNYRNERKIVSQLPKKYYSEEELLIKNTSLKDYFPMIRTREEILTDIEGNPGLNSLFHSWKEEQQEEFLNFCTGAKGVKILYDSFFKEILNPESVPQRLEDWLSLLLGQRVRILNVLP